MSDADHRENPTRVSAPIGRSPRPFGSDGRPEAGLMVTERVRLSRPLGQGGMAEVWVGEHLTLGSEVAVKFLRGRGDAAMRERFAREAQLAAKMDHPHAVRVFDHGHTEGGTPFLVMELVDGDSLWQRLQHGARFTIAEVVEVVDQVAQVLTAAHARDIIHRDIKPHNIMLLNGPKTFVKVLDFGLAKTLADVSEQRLTQDGWVLGTPSYMAPEQLVEAKPATRITDGWGLSVVAYELLTGKLPFPGRQQAAIALGMLVQRFDDVTELRPELPASAQKWFLRAFSVEPDARFADAETLGRTFADAVSGANEAGFVDGQIRLSNRVYGRDAELAQLVSSFEACTERCQLVFIEGYAGVGKTALVDAARRKFASAGVVFVDGKFDQFNRARPYDSLVQAMRKLVRQLLTRDASSLETKRARFTELLGGSAGVLGELIPELEDLLGAVDPTPDASPSETKVRFQNAIARFLQGCAEPDRPLVLFLDDLHWADLPTLDLLGTLGSDPTLQNLMIIGSFRGGEVDAHHPLHKLMSDLRERRAEVREIALRPLTEDAVLDMLSDVLGSVPGRVRLAVLCHEKTRGNPFFLRRFLETLHSEGMLRFDPDAQSWTWDASKVLARPVGDDVVEFIAAELRELPDTASRALSIAACIGGEFDLGTLAHLLEVDRRKTIEFLRPVLSAHYIVPSSEDSWDGESLSSQRVKFRFAHDRIQQAARRLIDDAQAQGVHRRVAAFLLEHLPPHEREARLFELVEHMNRGSEGETPLLPEGQSARDLNLSAARRASRAAAFAPAGEYYRNTLALVDESQWVEDYETTFSVHVEGARAAYVNGDLDEMSRLIDIGVRRARTKLDEVRAREVRIHAFIQEQKLTEAVHLALDLLRELESPLPAEPTDSEIQPAVGAALGNVKAHDTDAIQALPIATDARAITAQRIRQSVMSAAYLSTPQLLPLLACELIRSTFEDGIANESAYGFAVFGIVLNAGGLIDTAYQSGKIARILLERTGDRSTLARTLHVVNAHVDPFMEPIADSVERERHVHQVGLDTGDLEYAAWGLHIMVAHGFYAGMPLHELAAMDKSNRELLLQHRQLPALGCTRPYSQAILNCIGSDLRESTRLIGPDYDEERHMLELLGVGFRGAAYILTVVRTFVRFLFRDVEGAIQAAESGAEYADGAVSTFHQVWWHQLHALSALAARGAEGLPAARESLAELERWNGFCEANNAHRVAMVQAEIARVEGRDGDALAHYDAGIAHAREEGFVHEEGLINELAARFYIEKGSETPARAYLREAREAYDEWGAVAKVDHLQAELGHVMRRSRGRR